ncbi:amidophosphoribosyltransferase [Tenuibacillus multivorans]|uniref:Amidophosphoribosyltransferase n=1 Tax=Tenuibacillus multivorans TaxID=237069 RepID=A0A1H0F916_9BACI|nr:amidophosphoribosyltransferase [Tenuibacillus multivorans]GEL78028.1 amidophosphoribosyltransferase [Tenuibacillus multivorans]SDN91012.1 amidophosphoribosyltransferase [Tenuibacillus multivorans]
MLAEIKGLNEECGIFGVYGHPQAAQMAYYGLHALQHRGQEGAGIVVSDGTELKQSKGPGLVTEVFNEHDLKALNGQAAIGHVRYSTAGGNSYENIQPLFFQSSTGSLAMAHNGNLVNAMKLREELETSGSIFQTTSDTEVIAHLIKRGKHQSRLENIKESLRALEGAYAIVMLTEDQLIAALDPRGMRPLSLGKVGSGYAIASETCAFDVVGAEYIREIHPGEILVIDEKGMHVDSFAQPKDRAICTMEYVYFARPDSNVDGDNIHSVRKRLGKTLADVSTVEADVVTGVPDSSISAAIGFAEQSGIPYELGLIKNRYVGRTFIQPSQELRERGVQMKLSAVRKIVEGKRVVMVDDSIVRGTTSKRIVKMLKEAGATEVHVRISSPPITHPCFYGIDTSTSGELMAANHSIEEMRDIIGADSLSFLPIKSMVEAVNREDLSPNCGHCLACFTGNYPTDLYDDSLPPYKKEQLIGARN